MVFGPYDKFDKDQIERRLQKLEKSIDSFLRKHYHGEEDIMYPIQSHSSN